MANREYRYIGTRDDPLSELGENQAIQLAEALSVLKVAAVYSSPLQRTFATALPIAARHSLEVQRVDDLRECDFGTWEGLTPAEIIARSPENARRLREWEQDPISAPPGGESFETLQNALALLIPVAWKLLRLRSLARHTPSAPATSVLLPFELKVLELATH